MKDSIIIRVHARLCARIAEVKEELARAVEESDFFEPYFSDLNARVAKLQAELEELQHAHEVFVQTMSKFNKGE